MSLRISNFSILFLFLLTMMSWECSAQKNRESLELLDYRYGDDSLHRMDVHLIKDRTPETPLLILVHGGGWMSGDKRDFNYLKDYIYPMGVNVVNLNYRLANQESVHYKEIMADLSLALGHLYTKADEWHIRPRKWIMWGNSAGGHLTLLYAYNYDKQERLSAAVSFAGPVKLDDVTSLQRAKPEDINGLLPLITGKAYITSNLDTAYRLASPYYGNRYIPTLLIHGTQDHIVPLEQSELMYTRLQLHNVPTDFIILENGDHGGGGATEYSQQLFRNKTITWIEKYSK